MVPYWQFNSGVRFSNFMFEVNWLFLFCFYGAVLTIKFRPVTHSRLSNFLFEINWNKSFATANSKLPRIIWLFVKERICRKTREKFSVILISSEFLLIRLSFFPPFLCLCLSSFKPLVFRIWNLNNYWENFLHSTEKFAFLPT